jgi:hypothetical protein
MFERRFDSIFLKNKAMNEASFYHRLSWQRQPACSRAIPLKYNLNLPYNHYNSVNRKSQVKSEIKSKCQYFLGFSEEVDLKKTKQLINLHKEIANDYS